MSRHFYYYNDFKNTTAKSMMGDHSNEETESPTNSSAVDDHDATLPPLPTEDSDIWQVYLIILFLFCFLGGAYLALQNCERRWLFECTWHDGVTCVFSGTSSHTVPGRTTVFSCKTSNMYLIAPFQLCPQMNAQATYLANEKRPVVKSN
jgi:hypothetical protein